MNLTEQTMADVPRPDGFVGALLADLATGQVLATVQQGATGDAGHDAGHDGHDAAAAELAASVSECLHRFGAVGVRTGGEDDFEDLVVTTTGHHHLVRLLSGFAGQQDAFVVVTVRRDQANLGLARFLLRRFEVALVA